MINFSRDVNAPRSQDEGQNRVSEPTSYETQNRKIIEAFVARLNASPIPPLPIRILQRKLRLRNVVLCRPLWTTDEGEVIGEGWLVKVSAPAVAASLAGYPVIGRGVAIVSHLREVSVTSSEWVFSTEGEVYSYQELPAETDLRDEDGPTESIQGRLRQQRFSVIFSPWNAHDGHYREVAGREDERERVLQEQARILESCYRSLTET